MAFPVSFGSHTPAAGRNTVHKSSGGNFYYIQYDNTATTIEAWKTTALGTTAPAEVDGANRITRACDVLASISDGTYIHVVSMNVTDFLLKYHRFNMSTDLWAIRDHTVSDLSGMSAPAAQYVSCDIMYRPGAADELVIAANGLVETIMGVDYQRIHIWHDQNDQGTASWTGPIGITSADDLSRDHAGGHLVLGSNDRVHVLWHYAALAGLRQNTLSPTNTLSARTSTSAPAGDNQTPFMNLNGISYNDAGTQRIFMPCGAGSTMYGVKTTEDGSFNILAGTNEDQYHSGFSLQVAAGMDIGNVTVVANGTDLYSVFIKTVDNDICYRKSTNGGDTWSASDTLVKAGTFTRLSAAVIDNGGQKIGYIYEDAGVTKYDEISLGNLVAINQATETDSAFAISWKKTKAINQATEADTAFAADRRKQLAIGLAAEADTAFAPDWFKQLLVGLAIEADTAFAMSRSKVLAVGVAQEVDTAFSVSYLLALGIGLAAETDTAFAPDWIKQLAIGLAAEADTAFAAPPERRYAISQAQETDTAFTPDWFKQLALGLAIETDIAFSAAASGATLIGLATETDSAFTFDWIKQLAVGLAAEADSAFAQSWLKQLAVGLAAEADTAMAMSADRSYAINQALEADTAFSQAWRKQLAIGLAVEANTAFAADRRKQLAIGLALEAATAFAMNWAKAVAIGNNGDPRFDDVKTLLPFDGGDGATWFPDAGGGTWTPTGDVHIAAGQGAFEGRGAVVFSETGFLTAPYVPAEHDWWTQNYSIEAMVRATSWANWSSSGSIKASSLFGNHQLGAAEGLRWGFGPNSSGNLVFYYLSDIVHIVESVGFSIPTSQPAHIAMDFEFSTGEIKLFIDGAVVATETVIGTPTSNAAWGLTAGNYEDASFTFWPDGFVDNLRVTRGGARRYPGAFTPPGKPFHTFKTGPALEFDYAHVVRRIKSRAIALAAETDTAFPAAASGATLIGLAAEADTAFAQSALKQLAIGLATETDTAFADDWIKQLAIGLAAETDSAFAQSWLKQLAIGLAAEADTAFPVEASGAVLIGLAAETDTAFAADWIKQVAIGLATVTDTAFAQTWLKQLAIGLAAEADSAFATDWRKELAINPATEADSAQPMVWRKQLATGLALEVDTAFPVAAGLAVILGLASEATTALAMDWGKLLAVGVAQETDTGFVVDPNKLRSIGLAAETDTAFGATPAFSTVLGLAVEADSSLSVVWSKSLAIGQALEIDSAQAVVADVVVIILDGQPLDLPLVFSKLNIPLRYIALDMPLKHNKLTLH